MFGVAAASSRASWSLLEEEGVKGDEAEKEGEDEDEEEEEEQEGRRVGKREQNVSVINLVALSPHSQGNAIP